jgi:hypothetical protein
MGVKRLSAIVAVLALGLVGLAGAASGPAAGSARYVESRQAANGGFAEAGRVPDGQLTAWAALGLVAGDGSAAARTRALEFLRSVPLAPGSEIDVALRAVALESLGDRPAELLDRLRRHRSGALVNETVWTVIALRGAGEKAPPELVQAVLTAQAPGGGWPWSRGGVPDSNDTAAAIQALRAAGIDGAPLRRGVVALRSFQNRDGGFGLTKGRASDAQSTAWAIQALIAAGERVGKPPFRFLARLRREDGSYRYSLAYATTPVWVTSQVLPALAGRPFPLS